MGFVLIVLVNGGPALDRFGHSEYLGRLVSPRAGNLILPGMPWAADNDALKAWDEDRFVKMLNRLGDSASSCLFVAAPDAVVVSADGSIRGDARKTVEKFWDWRYEIVGRGFPVALVGQDGAEDLELPWDAFDALFLGGSTEWKLSSAAADLVAEANALGKWTHMGRVNSQRRLRIAYDAQVKSVDGTGWSMFPDDYLKRDLPFVESLHRQRTMFDVARHP